MKMFQVFLRKDVAKFLDSLDGQTKERIKKKLKTLEFDPYSSGSIKLAGAEGLYRIRIGDFRVLYEINNSKSVVLINKIDWRSRVYK